MGKPPFVLLMLLPVLLGVAPSPGFVDYAALVDPWIESNRGRRFFSPPAAMPFGLVKLTPHGKTRIRKGADTITAFPRPWASAICMGGCRPDYA